MSASAPKVAPLVLSLVFGGVLLNVPARADQALIRAVADSNVNQRYVIESVSIAGVEVADYRDTKLSSGLRRRLTALVGSPCDMATIGDIAGRLRTTLHLQDVHEHLSRGSTPERVRVNFEVVHKDYSYDLSVPRFLYNSNQGWTTEVSATGRAHAQSISVALGSNGDDLTERFTGFSTRYEDAHLFSDHIRFAVAIEGYHDLWNPATRRAVAADSLLSGSAPAQYALYRNRRNVAPELTFAVSRDFSLSIGVSFENMGMERPISAGAPEGADEMSASANAATAEANFQYTSEAGDVRQVWNGRYGLRLGTHELGSDYAYSRQDISVRYEWTSGRNIVADRLLAGILTGQAPLFERFVLGNSSTLLGWNRYQIDPLGGDRTIYNSVSYGRRFHAGTAELFYDAGFIGDRGRLGTLRHSLGLGFRQGIFNVAMAFPVDQGHVEPVFMAGMNY